MNIQPVAHFFSPLTSKFGIPRQNGLAPALTGFIVLEPQYRSAEALRGMEDFDYLWLIWEFSAIGANALSPNLTVRPPRLGGNKRIGVFASRSPFRPNRLGLSCVRLDRVEWETPKGPVVHVLGADLMDGTPIYDIKPYVAYADSHADVRSGFVDSHEWQPLTVEMPRAIEAKFGKEELTALRQVLAQDPRPRYHDDPHRVYGMPFAGRDIRFRVEAGVLTVVSVV